MNAFDFTTSRWVQPDASRARVKSNLNRSSLTSMKHQRTTSDFKKFYKDDETSRGTAPTVTVYHSNGCLPALEEHPVVPKAKKVKNPLLKLLRKKEAESSEANLQTVQEEENNSSSFQLNIPSFSNDNQIRRSIHQRIDKFRSMNPDEVIESKVLLKKQSILNKYSRSFSNHASTALSSGAGSAHNSTYKYQSLISSNFVGVVVLDRMTLAGTHLANTAFYPRPNSERGIAELVSRVTTKFKLNSGYKILVDRAGQEVSSTSDLFDKPILILTNDQGLVRFLQEVHRTSLEDAVTPFGLTKKKLEVVFYQIKRMEAKIELGCRLTATRAEPKSLKEVQVFPSQKSIPVWKSNKTRKNYSIVEQDKATNKVLEFLDGRNNVLSSSDIEDLYKLTKERAASGSKVSYYMRQMLKEKRNRSKYPPTWKSKKEFLSSEKVLVPNPKLEKLELVEDLYEREQRGFNPKEEDEDEIHRKIYERLGELMNINPDLKFMGQMEHSHMNKVQMVGKVLEEVFKKNFKGNFEVAIPQIDLEVDPEFRHQEEKKKFIEKNKTAVVSLKRVLKDSVKNIPRLVSCNIPQTLAKLKIGRIELYSFYILFKALSVVSSQIVNQDGSLNTSGVLFDVWRKGILQLDMMSEEMAWRVYLKIDDSNEGVLDWQEFLKGMQIINAKTKLQMIELFTNLADTKRSGYLNFEEMCELSRDTLRRYFRGAKTPFFFSLAEYFAKFIFETCGTSLNEKLRIDRIKELIEEAHPTSNLIVMFCGADL